MNIAEQAIAKKTVTLVLTFVMIGGGLIAYQTLARLEDPEFTIKEALVITPYPGASAAEVEEEVSDQLELAVQQLGQLDEVESRSARGLSTLNVRIKKTYVAADLPQIWDELRRKVGDAQGQLPPGAGPSIVVDDFGDVYGIFLAIYGEEYSDAELKDYVDLLRRELVLVDDVAKVETWGERQEAIYVEYRRDKLSQMGISVKDVIDQLQQKNIVADAGRVKVGPEYIAIDPTGTFTSVEQFESLLISEPGAPQQIYLRDVAEVKRGYTEPPGQILRFNGKVAIGVGISTVAGGNVVTMGEAVKRRLEELAPQTPLGIEWEAISFQSDAVTTAIRGFVVSLLEAVAIVIVVLLLFMGLRSGLIIGFVLFLTICGSFIVMSPVGVALERISLGALIIALGMLVDNAIVVTDGMLVRIKQGQDAKEAARDVVGQTALPLLGATIVAILAFAAIGTSKDSTGEFCRSLFQVVFISLSLSWVTGVTVTPLLCVMFLKPPAKAENESDAYGGAFYGLYRGLLRLCIRFRRLTVAVVVGIFVVALWGFGFVDQSFFPSSTRPQFMVDFWLPQGTHIKDTAREAAKVEEYLEGLDGVTGVTSLIGQGALRFLLTYTAEKSNSAYTQFLVDVDDYRKIKGLIPEVEKHLAENFPDALSYAQRFELGPGGAGKVQARLRGPDAGALRDLADRVKAILANNGAKAIRTDWRQRVKVVRPKLAEEEANLAGIQRPQVAAALKASFEGVKAGVYREADKLIPIMVRAPENERDDIASMKNIWLFSPAAGRPIPITQVVAGFETAVEDEVIVRLDRTRTLTVFSDPQNEQASVLFERVRAKIEALEFPADHFLEWGGEYEDSKEAQAGLMGKLPIFVLAMILIVIALFNSLRQPAIIWLCVPLALIGVTAGLLITRQPFGFMALLGFLSLSGMLIKNAIVLIDEINLQVGEGKHPYRAVVDSGVSRLRPVAMAALTTALGMIPLLLDAFFIAMAVTIIFGLIFATVLTMVFVPVLYAIFFGVREAGS